MKNLTRILIGLSFPVLIAPSVLAVSLADARYYGRKVGEEACLSLLKGEAHENQAESMRLALMKTAFKLSPANVSEYSIIVNKFLDDKNHPLSVQFAKYVNKTIYQTCQPEYNKLPSFEELENEKR